MVIKSYILQVDAATFEHLEERVMAICKEPLKTPARRPGKKTKTKSLSPFEIMLEPVQEPLSGLATGEAIQSNFEALAKEVAALRQKAQDEEDTDALLEGICNKVNFLQDQIGEKPPKASPTLWGYSKTAHMAIKDMVEDASEFWDEALGKIMELKRGQERLTNAVEGRVNQAVKSILQGDLGWLIQEAYDYMTNSGPGVEQCLQVLERSVSSGSLSFSTRPTSMAADDSATQVSELHSEVNSLFKLSRPGWEKMLTRLQASPSSCTKIQCLGSQRKMSDAFLFTF